MKRVTNKHCQEEMENITCIEKPEFPSVWCRLCEIENILGDEYDLEQLKTLVNANTAKACEVSDRSYFEKSMQGIY